jgi:DNA polymerase-3 subunit epsilon
VHGITTEMARTAGRPAWEVVGEIVSMLSAAWNAGIPAIVYNASYDLTLLDREFRRHYDAPLAPGHVIDPFVLDKQHDRYRRGSRKLLHTARHYGIELSELDAHGAAADALAAARVAWKLARVYPALGAMSLAELHEKQIGWHAEQARSLAAHFRSKGNDEHVPTEWPLRPVPAVIS